MSIPPKYHKYDKGRFVKPLSRKQKAKENREYEEKLERTRRNIVEWIAGIPETNTNTGNTGERVQQEESTEESICGGRI